jgi:hypothetical protein
VADLAGKVEDDRADDRKDSPKTGRRGWPRHLRKGEAQTSPEMGTTRLAATSLAEARNGT